MSFFKQSQRSLLSNPSPLAEDGQEIVFLFPDSLRVIYWRADAPFPAASTRLQCVVTKLSFTGIHYPAAACHGLTPALTSAFHSGRVLAANPYHMGRVDR
jgi:hypothetical protein